MKIGNQEFDLKQHTYVMGILNITPDSFSDGNQWNTLDAALFHIEEMIADGASIIDIGGESTRPGYTQLNDAEEIDRVVPIIEAIKARFDIPISIDTYKSSVAAAALHVGVDMVNDIWGLKYDADMAHVIAKANVPCCLMHNRMQSLYMDFMRDVISDLQQCIQLAEQAHIPREHIILDPGIGFGKSYEQNLHLMNHLQELNDLGYPLLLGTSRKSIIGLTLNLPVQEREEGTLATTVMGVMKGCSFIRVHNVRANVRAIQMTEAILRA